MMLVRTRAARAQASDAWSQSDEGLDFYVRLFGAVVFRVRLKAIRVRKPLPAYIQELDTGKSLLSDNGLAGPFTVLNP